MSNAEQAHPPNPYPLSLGLLTHPDRQRSGIGDAGRSAKMKLLAHVVSKLRPSKEEAAKDVLASLVLAAREDAEFRNRVMFVLNLPALQRESLVKTAVEEMERRGEPAEMRAAFSALATPEGAEIAARAIEAA